MVPPEFANFFIAAAGAGGALIGLLFVSVSIAPHRTVQASAPIEARVMSSSAFTALLNGFLIALGATLPHWNIGLIVVVMSLLGISHSLNQVWSMLKPWPSWQNVLRRLWLTVLSLYIYGYELVLAIQLLLISPTHSYLISTLGTLIISIYAIALLRAWLLLGVQRTGLLAWMNPLYEINKGSPTEKGESTGQVEVQVEDTA